MVYIKTLGSMNYQIILVIIIILLINAAVRTTRLERRGVYKDSEKMSRRNSVEYRESYDRRSSDSRKGG